MLWSIHKSEDRCEDYSDADRRQEVASGLSDADGTCARDPIR